jgi:hypothetical protein
MKDARETATQIITLERVYAFTCPVCGAKNNVSGVPVELNEEELDQYEEEVGERPQPGDIKSSPDYADCEACKTTFAVRDVY